MSASIILELYGTDVVLGFAGPRGRHLARRMGISCAGVTPSQERLCRGAEGSPG